MSPAYAGQASPPWWALLPPAEARVSCGEATHRLRWEEGRLTAADHPDAEAELVLAALGGDRSECVDLVEWWGRRGDDLEVLAVGPRSATDELTVTPQSVPGFGVIRTGWVAYAPLTARGFGVMRASRTFKAQPMAWPQRVPGGLAGYGAMLRAGYGAWLRARGQPPARVRPGSVASFLRAGPGPAPVRPLRPHMQQFRDQMRRASERRTELFSLLALGPEFQLRLSATVAAAWADGGARTGDRDAGRPALIAALAGRLAPAAQAWLGVDPGRVDVSLHEGEGWGRLALSGTGRDRRLSAALPVGWLASVWAAGLAVTAGHLIVAVTAGAWPQATVLGVPEPGADPVVLTVRAAAEGWTLAAGDGDGGP
jgi:hypothetical protein